MNSSCIKMLTDLGVEEENICWMILVARRTHINFLLKQLPTGNQMKRLLARFTVRPTNIFLIIQQTNHPMS